MMPAWCRAMHLLLHPLLLLEVSSFYLNKCFLPPLQGCTSSKAKSKLNQTHSFVSRPSEMYASNQTTAQLQQHRVNVPMKNSTTVPQQSSMFLWTFWAQQLRWTPLNYSCDYDSQLVIFKCSTIGQGCVWTGHFIKRHSWQRQRESHISDTYIICTTVTYNRYARSVQIL